MAKRGETRDKILRAAGKIFFEYGYEAASIKMIIEEAGVVTGSFYHFFPSKEILFEEVVKAYMENYMNKVNEILQDDSMKLKDIEERYMEHLVQSCSKYFGELNADCMHWTIQSALRDKTVSLSLETLKDFFDRRVAQGRIRMKLDVDTETLAKILIRGSEAIVQGNYEYTPEVRKRLIDFWGLMIEEIK